VRVGVLEPGAVATEVIFTQQRASPGRPGRRRRPHRRAAGADIADGITYRSPARAAPPCGPAPATAVAETHG
jgi:hypothetical protein